MVWVQVTPSSRGSTDVADELCNQHKRYSVRCSCLTMLKSVNIEILKYYYMRKCNYIDTT